MPRRGRARVAHPPQAHTRLRFPPAPAHRPSRARGRRHLTLRRRQAPARRRHHRDRARREGRARRAEREREDHAARGDPGARRTGRRHDCAGPRRRPAYFSQHTQELPRQGSVLDATTAETGLTRPQAQTLLGRFLFSGWETHGRTVTALSGGATTARARAPRGFWRELPRPRRADEPPRPREPGGPRSRTRGVSGDGADRLPRPRSSGCGPRPHRRHRGRHVALVRRRLGRQSSSGCGALAGAEATRREARQAPAATIPPSPTLSRSSNAWRRRSRRWSSASSSWRKAGRRLERHGRPRPPDRT